ncbi:MAG: hypothetical protein QM737_02865 [Ferruginibacter sp.]
MKSLKTIFKKYFPVYSYTELKGSEDEIRSIVETIKRECMLANYQLQSISENNFEFTKPATSTIGKETRLQISFSPEHNLCDIYYHAEGVYIDEHFHSRFVFTRVQSVNERFRQCLNEIAEKGLYVYEAERLLKAQHFPGCKIKIIKTIDERMDDEYFEIELQKNSETISVEKFHSIIQKQKRKAERIENKAN